MMARVQPENTQGHGRYSRLTPQKVPYSCKRNIFVMESSGPGDKMKSAAKRAASEALVQILAVTAVLVFAEFILYSRKLSWPITFTQPSAVVVGESFAWRQDETD
jgi:hypothetical protein